MTTTTLPALADAMTAAELREHANEMCRQLGDHSQVFISTRESGGGSVLVRVSVYPSGCINSADAEQFTGDDWPAAINAAYAWIATRPIIARAERVRKMALAIIDIKDQDGSVTERRLRARDFTAAEITDLGAEACARAAELCLGAPFEIVT